MKKAPVLKTLRQLTLDGPKLTRKGAKALTEHSRALENVEVQLLNMREPEAVKPARRSPPAKRARGAAASR